MSRRLPRSPDRFGTWWLGRHGEGGVTDPAIFPSKRLEGDCVVHDGTFLLYLGSAFGFLLEGAGLRKFARVEDALIEVNRRRL